MRITPWRLILAAFLAASLSGCGRRPLQETPLPSSQINSTLKEFQPPDMLDHLSEWFPGDWRVHLLRGLTDTTLDARLASLWKADSLRPDDPLPAYALASTYLSSPDSAVEVQARPALEKALSLDPENGVLRVMLAYVLLREGQVPRARALFLDPRRVPRGTFYQDRIEEAVLGLFSHGRQWNPYTLTEAAGLYRSIPLPPFEKMIDILYSVFLSPLEDRPYDIRIRGRQAAASMFRLGRSLRTDAWRASGVLNTGYDQEALGFMFQLKAGEFQTLFHRTFRDTASARRAFEEVAAVQAEYQVFNADAAALDAELLDYLDRWRALILDRPDLSLSRAVDSARTWTLWRHAQAYRYPARDDRP